MSLDPKNYVTKYRHTRKSAIMIQKRVLISLQDEADRVDKKPLLKFCMEDKKEKWHLVIRIKREKV